MSNENQKRVLITGSNGAMAVETIKHLIKDGFVDIVMACRIEAKGNTARQEILSSVNNAKDTNISVIGGFDMNKPLEIEKAVNLLSGGGPFDIVFLAAGFAVFGDDYQHVEWNGKKIEKTVFQNLIGSHVTLSELKKNNLLNPGARVVLAGGEGARGIDGLIEKPNFDSPEQLRQYVFLQAGGKYNPMNAIGVSKLCGAWWVRKMAKIEAGNMDVIWFSPGLTSGSAGLKKLALPKRVVFSIMFGFMNLIGKSQTPEQGGRKYADCLEGKVGGNGDILGAPEGKTIGKLTDQTSMNPAISDEVLIEEFWDILEEVTGAYVSA